MIKAEIWSNDRCILIGPFPFPFIKLINGLAGRKTWDGTHICKIEGTPGNIRYLKENSAYEIEFIDKIGMLDEQETLQAMPTQHVKPEPVVTEYVPQIPYWEHQERCIGLSWYREFYAIFFEMSLGKTAIIIATAAILFLLGRLTGVLVLAPRGVHRQWINEQLPEHMDKKISWHGIIWKKLKIRENLTREKTIVWLSMNHDAIRSKLGLAEAKRFMLAHKGKVMIVVDESHAFKGQASDRTRGLMELGEMATYKRLLSGTPMGRNIIDLWSQFNFLSPKILGYKYLTAFKVRFAVEVKGKVVSQKNTEEFYSLIAPHTFRMTKDEAHDLPPKIPVPREYEMSDETAKHYKEMKETLLTEMSDGTIVDGVNAAVAMLRLHQIVCGHLPGPVGGLMHRIGGERIEAMMDIVRQVEGPIVIWYRFTEDREIISEALKAEGISFGFYRGTDDEREKIKLDFLAGKFRIFVANPASGGTGLNLQGACQSVIYYSNSFNAIDRWQSEDRTHRPGMHGSVSYFDIIARKSVDRSILRNLKVKKDLADLTLDEIRMAIVSEE